MGDPSMATPGRVKASGHDVSSQPTNGMVSGPAGNAQIVASGPYSASRLAVVIVDDV